VKGLKRSLLYGLIAAGIYFGISFWANSGHPFSTRVTVSVAHGALCLIMTFCSTTLMEFFFNIPKKIIHKYFSAIIFSGLLISTLMISVHLYLGTPEIFKTLFSSALTSLPYYFLFPYKLILELKEETRLDYRKKGIDDEDWKVKMFSSPYILKDLITVFKYNLISPKKDDREQIDLLENKFKLNENISNKKRIAFLGDLMPMYGKKFVLSNEIREMLTGVDYLICNFEGSFNKSNKVLLSQPHDESILDDLEEILPASKIVLSVANNHAADFGPGNLIDTISKLEKRGYKVIGLKGKEQVDLGDNINLVSATEWSNQPHGYLSFLENSSHHLKPENHFNILYPHWCHEMEYFPRDEEIVRAKDLLNDWDMIIGHHSHLPGLITAYNNDGLVAYSLGDACTGMPRRRYRFGMIVVTDIGVDGKGDLKTSSGEWSYTHLSKTPKKCFTLKKISNDQYFSSRS
jgi:hypothetical protein